MSNCLGKPLERFTFCVTRELSDREESVWKWDFLQLLPTVNKSVGFFKSPQYQWVYFINRQVFTDSKHLSPVFPLFPSKSNFLPCILHFLLSPIPSPELCIAIGKDLSMHLLSLRFSKPWWVWAVLTFWFFFFFFFKEDLVSLPWTGFRVIVYLLEGWMQSLAFFIKFMALVPL